MALVDHARIPLTFGPSPVHPLARLSEHLGGAAVWAKREDCNSGLAFGGNKVRKLEYLAAEAVATGCDTLVSVGGVQSNHTRAVAAVAARLGLRCVVVRESWVDWPDSVYDRVGNPQLTRLLGAEARDVRGEFGLDAKESFLQVLTELDLRGGKPYPIPAGASDHPLGGLGFARWAEELVAQERELGVRFDTIVAATGSGSTQAGMVAGFAALGERRRVIGVDITGKPADSRAVVARVARRTAALLGVERALDEDEIVVDERYHAGAYGVPDEETLSAIRLGARTEAMITDPVYEGKSLAALVDLVSTREIPADATVLYVHLGGQPAINAYSAVL
ncbi:1-aminocyclopropane-1-carboxylate deaminase [Actinokineospora auranticolor]|uniref:1-aminocyclopropane-1-carboxylate deaminase n=1 Tax=Actinokineospora auranticolor TaxID=155976 RepID=A0A2S6H0Q5_9PSEU|nr:1-aminocyclopropane-1-carboxylate deaminase [Actinokineospora auranticolor]PPK70990.1 1-aminocyclopropane-1-carboxylate deaminase [Actinokineospora auranticolor]